MPVVRIKTGKTTYRWQWLALQPSRTRRVAATLGARDGWRCTYCGCELVRIGHEMEDLERLPWGGFALPIGWSLPIVEHSIPKARGGTDDLDNLVLSCDTCNMEKATKTALEYWLILHHPHGGDCLQDASETAQWLLAMQALLWKSSYALDRPLFSGFQKIAASWDAAA